MEVLTSLAIILLCTLFLGDILKKIKLPSLLGMLIVGIVFGPYVLNLISPKILNISADLRQLTLVIILTRAGLNLNFKELKQVGTNAVLLSFVPASIEIVGYLIFAPMLLGLSYVEAGLLGAVMSAVSPAVIVPRMLKIKNENYGTKKGIPQMIMTASSVDDVFVIVLFSAFLGMNMGNGFSLNILWQIPVSIILGLLIGYVFGKLLALFYKKFHIRDSIKILILLSISFLLIAFGNYLKPYVPMSGLLAIIAMSAVIYKDHEICANRLSERYSKLWIFAEILLFVLVGAIVDVNFAFTSGGMVIVVMLIALVFRAIGVILCLIKSKLNFKERLFVVISYMPKATVQAGLGGIPLAMGLACGNIILVGAMFAILITAPIGAFIIDLTYKKLLSKNVDKTVINIVD